MNRSRPMDWWTGPTIRSLIQSVPVWTTAPLLRPYAVADPGFWKEGARSERLEKSTQISIYCHISSWSGSNRKVRGWVYFYNWWIHDFISSNGNEENCHQCPCTWIRHWCVKELFFKLIIWSMQNIMTTRSILELMLTIYTSVNLCDSKFHDSLCDFPIYFYFR